MPIINHIKNYLKVNLDVGIFSDPSFAKRLFTPFLKEKTFDGTGVEFLDDMFKEYTVIEQEIDAETEEVEISLESVTNVRSLSIVVSIADPLIFVQPDLDLYIESLDNQKFEIRGLVHMNFSTGPTKLFFTNSSLYKKIIKIVYCGG